MTATSSDPPPARGGPIREALGRLGAESQVYGLGQVMGRFVQFLLVPVLTRALTPGAYGVSELVAGYSQSVILFLVLGMDGALARFFYQEPDREARIRMVSSSLVFRLLVSVAVSATIAAFAAPLASHLIGSHDYEKYLRIGAITMPFTLLVMFANDVLRVTFQPLKFIALNFVQTVVATSLSVWFVIGMKQGVVGVLYGRLGADALCAGLGLILIRHALRPRFSRQSLRRMLAYGAPAIPALFLFGVIAGIDRYMLERTRSIEEVAVYAVALRFFSLVTVAASAFQLAYGPFAFARAGTPEAPRIYARVLALYVAIGSLGALLVASFAPEALAVLVPPSYRAAAAPALWLAFAAVALGAYTVTSVGIGLALRTPLLVWCAAAGVAAAIAGHAVLTPRFGPVGAGAAQFLGYAAVAVTTYAIAQRVHVLPYRGRRLATLFVVALGLSLAIQRFVPPGVPGVVVKLVAASLFALLGFVLEVHRDRGGVAHRPT
jgi:O-antigen/teichoic acid export membrane protein